MNKKYSVKGYDGNGKVVASYNTVASSEDKAIEVFEKQQANGLYEGACRVEVEEC